MRFRPPRSSAAGANDNASGCVTILEVARHLQKLISEGQAGATGADDPVYLAPGD